MKIAVSGKGGVGKTTLSSMLAGALARVDSVPSIHAYGQDLRDSLVAEGALVADGEHLRLTQDHVFSSPSTAAMSTA